MAFRTSSYSNGGDNCVEISDTDDVIAIRDSKLPNSPTLHFNSTAYRSFSRALLHGDLNPDK
ncbi:DUF397 domain-containing protein [Streptomyces sp. NPDC001407]|uniref:DUF397 domain-containing protein n=1 Tax=Streptomyces sp. NPDC001407 TaxID=3364573 RepID=UPI0036A7F7CB